MCIYETDASNVTWELRKAGCTDAVELFDNRSLKTCEDFEHLHFLRGLANTATALLIECRGADSAMLKVSLLLPSSPPFIPTTLSLPSLATHHLLQDAYNRGGKCLQKRRKVRDRCKIPALNYTSN